MKRFSLSFALAATAMLFIAHANPLSAAPPIVEADVCIYGGTSGGVAAAVQAARMGKKAVIVEPGKHLGGMTAGGLSAVDVGDPATVGGIAREYFTRLVARYGKKLEWDRPVAGTTGGHGTGGAYSIEPHVAEELFAAMAAEAKAPVHFEARLKSVEKEGPRIKSMTMEDGAVFKAKMFIDATYEGDLMAKSGASYTLEREGNAKYGETYNGIYYGEGFKPRTNHLQPGPNGRVKGGQGVWDRDLPLDPYVVPGKPESGLLPLVQAGEPGVPGEPAPGVQAYCFRLCLTTAADGIEIAPPADYDPKRYEIVAHVACPVKGWFRGPFGSSRMSGNRGGGRLGSGGWRWTSRSRT